MRPPLHRPGIVATALSALLTLLFAGCAPLVREPASAPAAGPAEFPEAHYRQAAAQGQPVYRVDAGQSLVAIEVRRAGSLARLGHDHVVASHEAVGYAAPQQGRADLYVELARLTVDEPALRAEAGFESKPTASDIEGTRTNMLDKVLESNRFPFAVIAVTGVDAGQRNATLAVTLTLHGNTRTLQAPAEVEVDADQLRVSGRFSFAQTDFGITPYALLGGAIAVRNEVDLRFRIIARRLRP
jgi:polyisoprenoid-binding protein YceI